MSPSPCPYKKSLHTTRQTAGGRVTLIRSYGIEKIIALISILLFSSAINAEEMTNFNNRGMAEYRKKNYNQAISFFQKAISQNPKNALAHYNLACAMNLYLSANGCGPGNECEFEVTEVLKHLKHAIDISPDRKKRALDDPDFTSLRRSAFFRNLAGALDLSNVKTVKDVLASGSWHSSNDCGGGLSDDVLTFEDSGKISAGCKNTCAGDDNDLEKCVIAVGYEVKDASVVLLNPSSPIKTMKIDFDGIEAHVKGIGAEGDTVDSWHEFSGYYGSP